MCTLNFHLKQRDNTLPGLKPEKSAYALIASFSIVITSLDSMA